MYKDSINYNFSFIFDEKYKKNLFEMIKNLGYLSENVNDFINIGKFSKIINNNYEYVNSIKNWINSKERINIELLYRLSNNGEEFSTFHELCDNKGTTLTLFQIKDGDKIGFFTPSSWDSNTGKKNDMSTFLFNLCNNIKYEKTNSDVSIFCKKDHGPYVYHLGCGISCGTMKKICNMEDRIMEKKAKNILIYAASLAALMLTASCNKEINEIMEEPASPTVHSIEVTVPVATETKASYTGGGAATTFEAGDKLYIKVRDGETYTYVGVLDNSAGAVSTFTGTLNKTAGTDYSGSDIITDCTSLEATLLPNGYDENYYVLTKSGATVTGLTVEPAKAFSSAATKAAAVPQVANASYSTTGSGAKAITLTPQNAVLYYTLSGLAASTSIDVTVSDGTTTVSGSVTTDDSGVATFAVGYAGGAGTKTYTVSTSGKDDDAVTASLAANKVYNVTRFMYPVGAIHGQFTVSSGKQVCFSKGNLQYNKSTNTWSFMDYQYSTVETTSMDIGTDYENQDIVSLFGWGTSGWDNSNKCYQPYNTSNDNSGDYANSKGYGYGPTDGTTYTYDLTGTYVNADWGHNAITNGGNTADTWRTPTGGSGGEWEYLFGTNSSNKRTTTSGILFAKATVNGVSGVILLPDDWSSSYYSLNSTNTTSAAFDTNTINETDWTSSLEAHGAVFLPAAGYRNGTSVSNVGSAGRYWSSTTGDTKSAYILYFGSSYVTLTYYYNRYYGYSVRLVRDVE